MNNIYFSITRICKIDIRYAEVAKYCIFSIDEESNNGASENMPKEMLLLSGCVNECVTRYPQRLQVVFFFLCIFIYRRNKEHFFLEQNTDVSHRCFFSGMQHFGIMPFIYELLL